MSQFEHAAGRTEPDHQVPHRLVVDRQGFTDGAEAVPQQPEHPHPEASALVQGSKGDQPTVAMDRRHPERTTAEVAVPGQPVGGTGGEAGSDVLGEGVPFEPEPVVDDGGEGETHRFGSSARAFTAWRSASTIASAEWTML